MLSELGDILIVDAVSSKIQLAQRSDLFVGYYMNSISYNTIAEILGLLQLNDDKFLLVATQRVQW